MENLTKLVQAEDIKGAWLSGLGAAMWAELGFYNLENRQYEWKKLESMMEITSLQGNIAWNGDQPVIHMHATLSDKDMKAFGGHVKELEVAGSCEISLHRWYGERLTRSPDGQTGLKLLDL